MAASYNELFGLGTHSEDASLEGWWPLQDDAASTAVDDASSNGIDGTLQGGDNTGDLATTGPNSWLSSALQLDGTSDYISLPGSNGLDIAGDFTVSLSINADVQDQVEVMYGAYDPSSPYAGYGLGKVAGTDGKISSWTGSSWKYSTSEVTAAAWEHRLNTNNNTNTLFHLDSAGDGGPTQGNPSSYTGAKAIGATAGGTNPFAGAIAGLSVFSRALTAAEIAQVYNGPEPVNSVAPAETGTETEGQTLTSTTGAWGLDAPFASGSNGTATYAYQWTRSNDGAGSGEADIGGATSSTYLLAAADVGKFIRCRVAATNDGGNDSAADTASNFTGAIAASVTYKRQLTVDNTGLAQLLTDFQVRLNFASRTFTVDAGTDVVTVASSWELQTGDQVEVLSTTTLPDPLALSMAYYWRSTAATSGTLHTTRAGALADTGKVDITDTGTGTHTVRNFDFTQADAAGDDLRFYDDESQTTALDYWIETWDGSANGTVWLEDDSIASSGTDNPWMFYGDGALAAGSSIYDAFVVGDDFSVYNKAVEISGTPKFCTDTMKLGTEIFGAVFNSANTQIDLYVTANNGTSWSVEKAIYASSSSRSHPYCDNDGTDDGWVTVKNTAASAVYSKRYTFSTTTLGSEVTVASGLVGVTDPKVMYLSGTGATATVLCFFRHTSGGNYVIACYRSTDGGANWSSLSTVHSESTTSLNSLEDIDAIIADDGNVLVAWEREVSEKGSASCRQRISTDSGSTWGSESTIIDNAGDDDEGGHYFLDTGGDIGAAGDLFYVYGSDKDTSLSYDKGQLFRLKSTDDGVTWGSEVKIWESHSNVEPVGEVDGNGDMLLLATKNYDASENTSIFQLISFHAVESADTDWSDKSWTQEDGNAYVADVGGQTAMVARGNPHASTRGFISKDTGTVEDYILEAKVRTSGSDKQMRFTVRHTDKNNHYLVILTATQVLLYERTGGTYSSLLTSASSTHTTNTWYDVRVSVSGSAPETISIWVNDVLKINAYTDTEQATGGISLAPSSPVGQQAGMAALMRVRKYASTEPTTSLGAEQAVGGGSILPQIVSAYNRINAA